MLRPSRAIYRRRGYGPIFGTGWDLYIANNANSNSHSYADFAQNGDYAVPARVKSDPFKLQAGTDNFSHDDWEVFYLG